MEADYVQEDYSRFMIYFKPDTLKDLRIISRSMTLSMVDFVDVALEAYIFKKHKDQIIPVRKQKRYAGPRGGTADSRIRYVMILKTDSVDRLRDIASHYNRRFTHVCDEALAEFITFTKQTEGFKKAPTLKKSDTYAVKGKKHANALERVRALLDDYKAMGDGEA